MIDNDDSRDPPPPAVAFARPDDMSIEDLARLFDRGAGDRAAKIAEVIDELPLGLRASLDGFGRERVAAVLNALGKWLRDAEDASLLSVYGGVFTRRLLHETFGANLESARLGLARRRRVLVVGETGVGKEQIAQMTARAVVALGPVPEPSKVLSFNVAAVPENLVAATLFGHTKGAFTDARGERKGHIRAAGPFGCLLLDEVGEMAAPMQAQLLRFLQDDEFLPVGSDLPVRVPLHVVAATCQPLAELQAGKVLRPDLYQRLKVTEIAVPSLRETLATPGQTKRVAQALLARAFKEYLPELPAGALADPAKLAAVNKRIRDRRVAIEGQASAVRAVVRELLPTFAWPGNLRECVGWIVQLLGRWHGDALAADLPKLRAVAADLLPREGRVVASGAGDLPEVPWPLHVDEGLLRLEHWYYKRAWAQAGGSVRAVAEQVGVDYQVALRRTRVLGLR